MMNIISIYRNTHTPEIISKNNILNTIRILTRHSTNLSNTEINHNFFRNANVETQITLKYILREIHQA